jgi:hypothetical protein
MTREEISTLRVLLREADAGKVSLTNEEIAAIESAIEDADPVERAKKAAFLARLAG